MSDKQRLITGVTCSISARAGRAGGIGYCLCIYSWAGNHYRSAEGHSGREQEKSRHTDTCMGELKWPKIQEETRTWEDKSNAKLKLTPLSHQLQAWCQRSMIYGRSSYPSERSHKCRASTQRSEGEDKARAGGAVASHAFLKPCKSCNSARYLALILREAKEDVSNTSLPPYKSFAKCFLWPVLTKIIQRRKFGEMHFYYSQVNLVDSPQKKAGQCLYITSICSKTVKKERKDSRQQQNLLTQSRVIPSLFLQRIANLLPTLCNTLEAWLANAQHTL